MHLWTLWLLLRRNGSYCLVGLSGSLAAFGTHCLVGLIGFSRGIGMAGVWHLLHCGLIGALLMSVALVLALIAQRDLMALTQASVALRRLSHSHSLAYWRISSGL
jgi:hypothetical protein